MQQCKMYNLKSSKQHKTHYSNTPTFDFKYQESLDADEQVL